VGATGNGPDGRSAVLAAVDLVELIGQSVKLKRRGKDYVGLCPFHSEKTPSFHVKPDKQVFYCFGCKASGTAFDFVMRRDRVEFRDALETLARQYNVELPRGGVSKEKFSQRQALLDAHSAAAALFEKLLSHPQQGAAARAYLEQRGFSDESVKQFRIGVAPESWDFLLKNEAMRKFPPPLLQQAGLVKARENNAGFYDTFRNRLMFPIKDESGRIIAFGGRVMPGSSDPAKYLNSPETPLFSKSRSIFGIDLARQKIVETRTVAVVEGYTDVVMAHQYGATNVVSILGTAMTEQHVAILRRFADRIVLLFDADIAGDAAVNRAVELFLTQPVEIAIASMPEGVDPDEFLLKHGVEEFNRLLSDANDALTYKWTALARQFAADGSLTGQQKAVSEYLQLLAGARGTGPVDAIRWGASLARVSRLTDIPVEELHRRFGSKRAGKLAARRPHFSAEAPETPAEASDPRSRERRPQTADDRAERWILAVLLAEPTRWHDVQQLVSPADFTDAVRFRLAQAYWNHQRDEGEPVFNEFLGTLDGPEMATLAVELLAEVEELDIDPALRDALAHLAQARLRKNESELMAQLRRKSPQTTEADEVRLLAQLQEQVRRPDMRRTGSTSHPAPRNGAGGLESKQQS
jgi:DNA primase